MYLIGRMAAERGPGEFGVPDFNLDSDRGYAWHCWDWDRSGKTCVPDINAGRRRGLQLSPAVHVVHSSSTPTTTSLRSPAAGTTSRRDLNVHYVPGPNPGTCIETEPHHPNTDPQWRERLDHKEG